MKLVEMSDHEFGAWLRKNQAIDNFHHSGTSVIWFNPQKVIVALALFDNEACTRKIFLPKS